MKTKIIISILIASIILVFIAANNPNTLTLDKQEAKNAFEYLNKVRENPKEYSEEIGISLRKAKPIFPLIWNDTLAKVAEEKAMDMATNNYFSHVNKKGQGINILIHRAGYTLPKDFYKNKRNNFFESLAMGQDDGIEAIKGLIKDEGINPPAHRQHLLGLTYLWSTCYDIGIGFVTTDNPEMPSYTCIIIARHNTPNGELVK